MTGAGILGVRRGAYGLGWDSLLYSFSIGKIGLIASKDQHIREIPSKACRSVKYH
jgi:hypothetical protein